MIRTLYVLSVVSLLAATGWTATGIRAGAALPGGGVGLVLLTALQR